MQYTPGGTAVTKLRLATDRRRQNGETEADWHNIVVWGKTAKASGSTLRDASSRIRGKPRTVSTTTAPRSCSSTTVTVTAG